MMGKIRFATCASVIGLGASVLSAGPALASGFALREESAEGLGNAFAGQTAKAYNSSTAYYNPAGMSNLTQDEVAGTVTWIAPQAKFEGHNTSPLGGNLTGSQPNNAIKAAAVGTMFGVYKLNEDWSLGMSVAAPFGMRSDYKADWVGRYQALHSDVTDVEFSPTMSYKVNDHWSVGGGPRVDYIDATLSQAINSNAISLGNGGGAVGQDGSAKVWGDDTGYGYVLSTLYKFDESTRVGATYRSRIVHTLDGSVQVSTPGLSSAIASGANLISQGAKAKITLPDSFNIGAYHDINEHFAVMADASWTGWSTFNTLDVVGDNGKAVSSTYENWHNTYFISLGMNYKPDDKWVLHTGVAFDQAPVREANLTARIPDANRYWTSLGVTYNFTKDVNVNLAYTHIFADSATINNKSNSASGTLIGTYDNSVDIASASFVVKF